VDQERLKKLEAMERKQRELDDTKRDEERILREVGFIFVKYNCCSSKTNVLKLSLVVIIKIDSMLHLLKMSVGKR
jgi:hypothetical protein